MRSSIFIIFIVLFLTSCDDGHMRPVTSELYYREYTSFIAKIQKDHLLYSQAEWQSNDELYALYSDKWYIIYVDRLTKQQRTNVKKYSTLFHSYKLKASGHKIGKDIEEWWLHLQNQIFD